MTLQHELGPTAPAQTPSLVNDLAAELGVLLQGENITQAIALILDEEHASAKSYRLIHPHKYSDGTIIFSIWMPHKAYRTFVHNNQSIEESSALIIPNQYFEMGNMKFASDNQNCIHRVYNNRLEPFLLDGETALWSYKDNTQTIGETIFYGITMHKHGEREVSNSWDLTWIEFTNDSSAAIVTDDTTLNNLGVSPDPKDIESSQRLNLEASTDYANLQEAQYLLSFEGHTIWGYFSKSHQYEDGTIVGSFTNTYTLHNGTVQRSTKSAFDSLFIIRPGAKPVRCPHIGGNISYFDDQGIKIIGKQRGGINEQYQIRDDNTIEFYSYNWEWRYQKTIIESGITYYYMRNQQEESIYLTIDPIKNRFISVEDPEIIIRLDQIGTQI